jgi:hypothetical protein
MAVPDFDVCTQLYLEKKYPLVSFIGSLNGKMQMDDPTIFHKMVYDFNSLSDLLKKVGMKNIRKYDWKDT